MSIEKRLSGRFIFQLFFFILLKLESSLYKSILLKNF